MIKYYITGVDLQKLADNFNYKYDVPAIACDDGIIVDRNKFDLNMNLIPEKERKLFSGVKYEYCWNRAEPVYNIIDV